MVSQSSRLHLGAGSVPAQRGERWRQVGDGVLHTLAVTHVHDQAMHLGLLGKRFDQRIQAVSATAGEHQFPAGFCKTTSAGLAKT